MTCLTAQLLHVVTLTLENSQQVGKCMLHGNVCVHKYA